MSYRSRGARARHQLRLVLGRDGMKLRKASRSFMKLGRVVFPSGLPSDLIYQSPTYYDGPLLFGEPLGIR